jgi:tagatose 1,6-diphosphate aldolase
MIQLTPGKWRGLTTTSSPTHKFTMLAFDQRGNYVAMLPPETPFADAAGIKREVISALAPHANAVLLDPIYGLDAALAMPGGSGLLMALEKTGYAGVATARRVDFIPGWDVGKIKRMGAAAVKLLVYYHPDGGSAAADIESTIALVATQCQAHDIPLFVEPLAYSLNPDVPTTSAEFSVERPRIVRETARHLSGLGADILKLEFPVDTYSTVPEPEWQGLCASISEVCPVPWVLLSAGVDFEQFEKQVRAACAGGASGVLAGRAIWKESIALTTEARAEFLTEVGQDRLERLAAIVETNARSWTDFYTPMPNREEWYADYL